MLQITPSALQAFKDLLEKKGQGGQAIRIFTMGSGCCGPAMGMDVVETGQTGDQPMMQDGVPIHVEPQAALALEGVTIDFNGSEPKKGFIMRKPSHKSCCE